MIEKFPNRKGNAWRPGLERRSILTAHVLRGWDPASLNLLSHQA